MPKVFSVDEAQRLLPFLTDRLSEVFGLLGQVRASTTDIEDLTSIWGEEVAEAGHVDNRLYQERITARSQFQNKIQEIVATIETTGALVKDLDAGLVDFLATEGGEPVMLCWKFGEPQIKFWHPVTAGYSRRAPLRRAN